MGVTKQGNKWRARMWKDGKNVSIGTYDTRHAAQDAYDAFAISGIKPTEKQVGKRKDLWRFFRILRVNGKRKN